MPERTDPNEAMRLAEPPNIDNLKKIAKSDSTTAIRNALLASIKWIQCLEQSLKFEQAASFRDQVAELEAERDQLRAEVERYQWLREKSCGPVPLVRVLIMQKGQYQHQADLDAAIDHARTTHKETE